MSKFIPPPDQINNISPKKSKKSFDENGQSIFSEIKKVIKDSFAADAFEQVGAMNAVVIEIRQPDVVAMLWRNPLMFYQYMMKGVVPDYIEVRYRIPEMHAHLPEPTGPEDWLAINLHPYALMKKDKGMPAVGDIVSLDFADKNNFRGAMVVDTLNSNENPNAGGNCRSTDTANSAAPPLNMAAPSGDSQTSSPEDYSATNSPTEQSSTEGINYPLGSLSSTTLPSSPSAGTSIPHYENPLFSTGQPSPVLSAEELNKFKKNLYFITIEELRTMSDFRNVDSAAEILLGKKVASVCFSVAESGIKIRDVSRIKKLIKKLKEVNIDVGLSMEISNSSQFHDNFVFMADIAKSRKVDFIGYHLINNSDEDAIERHDQIFNNFCQNLGIDFYVFATENTHKLAAENFPSSQNVTFFTDNYYDFIRNNEKSLYKEIYNALKDAVTVTDAANDLERMVGLYDSATDGQRIYPSYYLGGINFLSTPNDPCIAGERNIDILKKNIRKMDTEIYGHDSTSDDRHVVLYTNYSLLKNDVASAIHEASGLSSESDLNYVQKQRFLSSETNTQTTNLSNVIDIVSSIIDEVIQEPSFNNSSTSTTTAGTAASGGEGTGDTQSAAASSPSAFSKPPGAQCTPISSGPEAGGPGGAGGSSAAVEPPSFRFDSIENYQNLGWTANNSAAINNVIFDFMEKFSAAVYRRLPANSPSFTGSNPKKIRLTSTARTYEKQAELMWDKIKNGGGDSAVYSLYGNKEWTKAVVNAYHAGNFPDAVAAVKKRVEVDGGGSAHLKGKGVDVHTWSHINAEGMNSDGASIAQMNNSKFVQAVVEAAKEVGARPVVEAYQQHVHISI